MTKLLKIVTSLLAISIHWLLAACNGNGETNKPSQVKPAFFPVSVSGLYGYIIPAWPQVCYGV